MKIKPKSKRHGFIVLLDCNKGVVRVLQRQHFNEAITGGHDWMALKTGVPLTIEVEK